jgi:lambda repressor-like predicted transcriptional regulator
MKNKPHHRNEREDAIAMIRRAMVEKKMTQAELSDQADCHEKTVQNLLHGKPVRDQTLFDVAIVLGLDFNTLKGRWYGAMQTAQPMELKGEGGVVAPTYMGAYTKAAVDHYIGSYLTLRPAFAKPETIVAYRTDITWDPEWPSLLFEERDRPDVSYSHRGRLYIPSSSMFIHLVSLTKGAMRMVLVSQIDRDGEMRGLISTLNKQRAQFMPVSAPIVYIKQTSFSASALGEHAVKSQHYAAYRKTLDQTVEDGYARLIE